MKRKNKFFCLSAVTVALFQVFFFYFVLTNGDKEYIPPAGILTYEYWNELVKNPELIDETLANCIMKISSVSCIVFVLEILYLLGASDLLSDRKKRKILLLFPIAFGLYWVCRYLLTKYVPVYRMFMLLLPAEFAAIVSGVLTAICREAIHFANDERNWK